MNAVLNWGNDGTEAPPPSTFEPEKEEPKKSWFKRQSKEVASPSAVDVQIPEIQTNAGGEQQQQKKKPWYQRQSRRTQEVTLVIACIVLILAINFTIGRYLLYPFVLFTTWVHEMCHAIAAWISGGKVDKLEIFNDGSGLAHVAVTSTRAFGFVASAGYTGAAVTGFILLFCRRLRSFPRISLIVFGVLLVLSCLFLVRNVFGFIVLCVEGAVLVAAGWKLPIFWLSCLFSFLAASCSLNAFESIRFLFEYDEKHDAAAVARAWGGGFRLWAFLWLLMSFILTGIGFFCALDPKKMKENARKDIEATQDAETSGTITPTVELGNINSTTQAQAW